MVERLQRRSLGVRSDYRWWSHKPEVLTAGRSGRCLSSREYEDLMTETGNLVHNEQDVVWWSVCWSPDGTMSEEVSVCYTNVSWGSIHCSPDELGQCVDGKRYFSHWFVVQTATGMRDSLSYSTSKMNNSEDRCEYEIVYIEYQHC